jgi:hypothetical protein
MDMMEMVKPVAPTVAAIGEDLEPYRAAVAATHIVRPNAEPAALLLALLSRRAAAGERAPTNAFIQTEMSRAHSLTSAMAEAGLIRVELYGQNFRRIWICAGPQTGLATAPPPRPGEPYFVQGPDRPTHVEELRR